MKKLFAILLAVAVICALSVTAFADSTINSAQTPNNTATNTVFAQYKEGAAAIDVYKVEVQWGPMNFTYTDAQKIWNPDELDWDNNVEPAWTVNEGSSNAIKVTNKSSKNVVASFTWDAGDNYTGITAKWTGLGDGDKVLVKSALNNAGAAGVADVTFTPNGALDEEVTILTQIGEIIVTITDEMT